MAAGILHALGILGGELAIWNSLSFWNQHACSIVRQSRRIVLFTGIASNSFGTPVSEIMKAFFDFDS
jgi:hypothetical protein